MLLKGLVWLSRDDQIFTFFILSFKDCLLGSVVRSCVVSSGRRDFSFILFYCKCFDSILLILNSMLDVWRIQMMSINYNTNTI